MWAPDALLLDFDGTLVDSLPVLRGVHADFLAGRGRRPVPGEFERLVGATLPEIVARLVEIHHLTDGPAGLLADYRRRLARAYGPWTGLAPGARALIERARESGIRLAVVTSANADLVRSVLDGAGVGPAFQTVVGEHEVSRGKPSPEPYRAALDRLGVPAGRSLAVEDSPAGIRSAVAAGVPTIGLARPGSPDAAALAAAGARDIVASLDDVARRLAAVGA